MVCFRLAHRRPTLASHSSQRAALLRTRCRPAQPPRRLARARAAADPRAAGLRARAHGPAQDGAAPHAVASLRGIHAWAQTRGLATCLVCMFPALDASCACRFLRPPFPAVAAFFACMLSVVHCWSPLVWTARRRRARDCAGGAQPRRGGLALRRQRVWPRANTGGDARWSQRIPQAAGGADGEGHPGAREALPRVRGVPPPRLRRGATSGRRGESRRRALREGLAGRAAVAPELDRLTHSDLRF